MKVALPFDHERLPASTRALHLRVNDLQYWNGHFFKVQEITWSKTGKLMYITWLDSCAWAKHTPPPSRWSALTTCHPDTFEWGRQRNASSGHAIYRPVTIIHEDPL